MRTFGLSEFLFIVQAAQWTLALSFSALFKLIYQRVLNYPDRR